MIDALKKAQSISSDLLANVKPEQLSNPTPCADWNVAQLIDHMVGAQHWGRCSIAQIPMDGTGEGSSAGDFKAIFDKAASDTAAAFAEPGALDKMVNPGFGDMPGSALAGLALMDTFTHSWDLAKATGQDTNLDPAIASMLLPQAKASIQDSFRSAEGGFFGPEKQAPEGASPADQLAAFLGRTV